jgi:hypothetical protein
MKILLYAIFTILFAIEEKGTAIQLAIQNGSASVRLSVMAREKPPVELLNHALSLLARISFLTGVIWAFTHFKWYIALLMLPLAPFLFGTLALINPDTWSFYYPIIACKVRGILSIIIIIIAWYFWRG